MARKTVVELLDDIDGTPADGTVAFALDGVNYQIDLSTAHAGQLRAALAPFAAKARKPAKTRTGRVAKPAGRSGGDRERSAQIRAWATQHGIQVSDRGRIPAQLVEAF